MPFADLNTIVITGTYRDFDQSIGTGTVTFDPPADLGALLDPAGKQVIVPTQIRRWLDLNGQVSFPVPVCDDPDITPSGWEYTVTEDISYKGIHRRRSYQLMVSITSPGGTVDLSGFASPAAPAWVQDTPPDATVGVSYSYTFAATGVPSDTYSVSSGAIPTGLTFNTASGLLSGIPTVADSFVFQLTASNGVAPDAVANVDITVAAAPPTGDQVLWHSGEPVLWHSGEPVLWHS